MPKMLRSLPYSMLRAVGSAFAGKHIGSRFPFVKNIYDNLDGALFRLSWMQGNVVDVQGSKMYVDFSHPDPAMRRTFRHYAVNRIHEETTTALFRRVLRQGDVVLDLGANMGYFTLLAASLVGEEGRVYPFEPEPRNYGCLSTNIALNNYDHIIATNKAVSDKPGTVKLFICAYDSGHHTIQQFNGIRSYNPQLAGNKKEFVEIEAVRLDDFFGDRLTPINVIKMDVEGAEMLALAGMENIIRANQDLIMFIEFFPLLIREMGQLPEEFARRLLEDFGFKAFIVEHDYSMSDRSFSGGLLPVSSADQIMNLCKGHTDHLNLYLEKSEISKSRLS
jgi:FkbM family methyltransferase